MFTTFTLLTALPLLTTAIPFPNLFPRYLGPPPGSCPDTLHPLESQFIQGYTQFCSTYLAAATSPHMLKYGTPFLATFDLGTPSGEIAKWVFKVEQGLNSNTLLQLPVDEAMCVEQFRKFLDTDEAGGLGGAYCVVDGTGGDKNGKEEMAGQGIVCVLGGTTSVLRAGGSDGWRLDFLSYRRTG